MTYSRLIDGTTTARAKPAPSRPRAPVTSAAFLGALGGAAVGAASAPTVQSVQTAPQVQQPPPLEALSSEALQAAIAAYRAPTMGASGGPQPTSMVPTGTPNTFAPLVPGSQPSATVDPEWAFGSTPTEITIPPENPGIPQQGVEGLDPGTQLQSLTDVQLNSLLDLIASRYNLTREQLLANEGQIGLQARALTEQLAQLRRDAVRSAQSGASERGLLRSGIHARQIAGIDTAIAGQASQGTAQAQTQLGEIGAAKAQIQAQIAAEQASARAASAAGSLQFQQGQTVEDLLAQLPLAPNQAPAPLTPANPYVASPVLPTTPSNASLFGNAVPTYNPGAGYTGAPSPTAGTAPITPPVDQLTPEQLAAYLRAQKTNQPRID